MHKLAFLLLWMLSVLGSAIADEGAGQKPLTPEHAADEVQRAWKAQDKAALEALAAKQPPDPWLVAEALRMRRSFDAAHAFAAASPPGIASALNRYVRSRSVLKTDPDEAQQLRGANAARQRADWQAVLEATDSVPEPILTVTRMRLCFTRGMAFGQRRRFADARRWFSKAADGAHAVDWHRGAAEAFGSSGLAAYRLRDWPGALEAWRKRLAHAEALEDEWLVSKTLNNIGALMLFLRDFSGALEHLRRAHSMFEALGQEAAAAQAINNIGAAYEHLGRYRAALTAYRQALKAQAGLAQPVRAKCLENIAGSHLKLGEFDHALDPIQRSIAIYRELNDEAAVARALRALGMIHEGRGAFREALAPHREALQILERVGDEYEEALALQWLGSALEKLGQHAEALELQTRALQSARKRKDNASEGGILVTIGVLQQKVGAYPAALEAFRRAHEIYEALGDRRGMATALADIAVVQRRIGEYQAALDANNRARSLFEAIEHEQGRAGVMHNISELHRLLGDYPRALVLAHRALDLKRAIPDRLGVARGLMGIANMHAALGSPVKALAAYRQTLAAFERLEHKHGIAHACLALADRLWALDDRQEAQRYLARARAAFEEMGSESGLAGILETVASRYADQGDHVRALGTFGDALQAYEALGDVPSVARVLRGSGRIRLHLREHTQALEDFRAALARSGRMSDPHGTALASWGIASVHLGREELEQAMIHARLAVETSSSLAHGLAEEEGARVRGLWNDVYAVGAQASAKARDASQLAFFLEQGRAGMLLETLGAREALRTSLIPEALRVEEGLAVAAARRSRVAHGAAVQQGLREKIRRTEGALREAQDRLQDVIARIQRQAKGASAILYPRSDDLKTIQATLAPEQALVMYVLLESSSLALVVRPERARIVKLASSDHILAACEDLLEDEAPYLNEAAIGSVRKLIVDPLEIPDAVDAVLISPHGRLGYVPFAPLLADKDVVYVPSATTYRILGEEAAHRGSGVLAVGDPVYETAHESTATQLLRSGDQLAPLPATRAETKAVGTHVLLGKDATKTRLVKQLTERPRWRAVHLACHGLLDPERPMLSSLALSADDRSDGYLTALEVFRMRIPADLVVLSACDTAKGRIYEAEGIVGLTRAFMFAGAPRVICSLWKVDDAATQALMIKFYELWNAKGGSKGLGCAAALARAQAFIRNHPDHPEWKHPQYWAAWVVWGLPS